MTGNEVKAVTAHEVINNIMNKDIKGIQRSIEELDLIVHPNNTIVNEIKIKLAELLLED